MRYHPILPKLNKKINVVQKNIKSMLDNFLIEIVFDCKFSM